MILQTLQISRNLRYRPRPARVTTALAVVGSLLLLPLASSASADSTVEPGDVVVSEDFGSGSIPAGWRAVDGEWQVQNGRLVGTAASGTRKLTFGAHLENYRFETTARFESVNEATRWFALGLDVPASGATPWWIATLRSGSTASNGVEFAQLNPAGAWNVTNTAAAPQAAATGRDVKVRIEVHGHQATWFLDGKQLMRTNQLQRSADGGLAFVVNGAKVSFDDVKVTALGPNGYLRPEGAPMTVIAHRGASSAAPENTLQAQEVARRGGADFIENDVQLSKDGVPYLMHDYTVDRTTDGTGDITALTAAQLEALDAGSWFAPTFAGAQVPTLAEQLADLRTRGGSLLLEVKRADTKEQVATMLDVVRAEKMTGRVFVQSFSKDHLRWVRELAPELPLGLLVGTLDADPVAVAKDLGLTSYNPSGGALEARPEVVGQLHQAGVATMVWTIDSAAKWQQYDAWGVDAIITNRPTELTGWNQAKAQQVTPATAVAVTSPADGAVLNRAQRPVLAVDADHADATKTEITVDGVTRKAGDALDLTKLPAGKHTVTVKATGASGIATATSTFTVEADQAGLGHLILTSKGKQSAVSVLLSQLAQGKYSLLAKTADLAGRHGNLPSDTAKLIASDARQLQAEQNDR
ncbi:glycerophosphodiester phosphodiesterase family protein [Streptomyces sp. NPDC056716]|uniref:glycerophosphodiester phosphodiesterase family protein n=1 Tax=unclassified Streptomyces TaxID=2593676 RepID=UPI00368C03F0